MAKTIEEIQSKYGLEGSGKTTSSASSSNKTLDSIASKYGLETGNQTAKSSAVSKPSTPTATTSTPKVADTGKEDKDGLIAGLVDDIKNWFNKTDLKQVSAMQQAAGGAAMAAAFSKDPDVKAMAQKRQEEAHELYKDDINWGYTAANIGAGAADKLQGFGNFLSQVGQTAQKNQMAQDAQNVQAIGKLIGNKNLVSGGKVMEQQSKQELVSPFRFADKIEDKIAETYGDVSTISKIYGDAAKGVGGMVPAIAATILTGAGSAASFLTSSSAAGNAIKEAKDAGVDDHNALAYGIAVGGIEYATEKLVDGLGGVFGKGLADKGVTALVKSLVKNQTAQNAVNALIKTLGEGAEEWLAEYGSHYANRLLVGSDQRTREELKNDARYSAMIGAFVSGIIKAGNRVIAGKAPDAKQAADEAASEAQISRSDGVSSQPTTDTSENAEAVRGMPGLATDEAGVDSREFTGGMGAASKDYTKNIGEQVPTQSKPTTESPFLTEEEKQRFAPGTHERISNEESVNRAQQNFYVDSDGNIVHLDATIEDLMAKDAWTGVDQDTAQIAMMQLVREARASGDYTKADAFNKKMQEVGASEAGRSLQARKKWIAQGGAHIVSEAMTATQGMNPAERSKVLDTVIELAGEYDNIRKGKVIDKKSQKRKVEFEDMSDELETTLDAKREIDGLKDLIRRTAAMRGTSGMFSKELSGTLEWALNRVAANGDIDFLRDFAANGIYNFAWDTKGASAGSKIKTYRRLSMLSKISTVMRNLVSNGAFDLTDTVSRDISVPLDILLSKATGTRSVAVDKSWFSEAKRKGAADGLAKSLLEVGLDVDASGSIGRYESTANRAFKMSGSEMERLMSSWEKYSGYALQTTDAFMKGGTAAEIQRGIDELINRGLIKDGENVNPMNGIAMDNRVKEALGPVYDAKIFHPEVTEGDYTQNNSLDKAGEAEALYRTFQDNSRLARATMKFREAVNDLAGTEGFGLGDILLPFAQTPANLASRALEYSPLGLVKGAYDLAVVMKKAEAGTLTAAEQAKAVQELGRGLNGTALIGIATALAASGIIRTLGDGRDDDDAKATALANMAGENGTQINVDALMRWAGGQGAEWQNGDTLVSISFLEPLNAQLTTGALVADDLRNEDMSGWEKFVAIAKSSPEGAIKAVLDMPVMSVFKDVADAAKYSNADTAGGKAMDVLKDYATGQASSFIPNAVKGIAQGTDPYKRNAYTGTTEWRQTWDNILAGMPVARNTLPANLDSYGNPVESYGGFANFLNSNVLPGSVTKYEAPTAYDMLMELYDASGDAKILPEKSAPNSITFDGQKYELDADQKQKWLQATGEKHEELLAAAEENVAFDRLSDAQKLEVLSKLRLISAGEGQLAAGVPIKQTKVDKAASALGAGDMVTFYSYWLDMETPANYSNVPNWQKYQTIAAMGFDDGATLGLIESVQPDTYKKIKEAYDQGVPLDEILDYYEAINSKLPDGTEKKAADKSRAIRGLEFDSARNRAILNRIF